MVVGVVDRPVDEYESRVTKMEEEQQTLQGEIEDLHARFFNRIDAVNDNMQSMLARFEVGGGVYPGGADVMMRDFRECFSHSFSSF